VAMDSLKFYLGPPCRPFYALRSETGVARPQVVFYPLGHPTLYDSVNSIRMQPYAYS
jgi:hypothetical protein